MFIYASLEIHFLILLLLIYESIFTVKQSINGGEATSTYEQQPQLPAVDDTSMYSNI